jgi:hypothetical protein
MVEDPCLGPGRLSLFLPFHSLARPPSSPTAAWGRRRGGKKKRRQEEEEEKEKKKKEKISPSPIRFPLFKLQG